MPSGSFEVIIIGACPANSSSAMHQLPRGIQPRIVERERFPRNHISDSLTGECGNCFRELRLEAYMHACDYADMT